MKRIFYYFERGIRKWSCEPDQCCGFSCDAGWSGAGGLGLRSFGSSSGFRGKLEICGYL